MTTKKKLPKETQENENREKLIFDEGKLRDDHCSDPDEAWWDSVCYPDPHISER